MIAPSPKILCIAGGSGCGKTTLAEGLAACMGTSAVSLLHLDDYQRPKGAVPMTASGRRNYDHPTAINWRAFVADLAKLKNGEPVAVTTHRKTSSMEEGTVPDVTKIVVPAPLVVVEGYLALHHEEARALYDASLFLRAPHDVRLARRRWVKDPQYVREVLAPMHQCFVEPTAAYATLVLDVDAIDAAQVQERTVGWLMSLPSIGFGPGGGA